MMGYSRGPANAASAAPRRGRRPVQRQVGSPLVESTALAMEGGFEALPDHATAAPLRHAAMLAGQRKVGNRAMARAVQRRNASQPPTVQRADPEEAADAAAEAAEAARKKKAESVYEDAWLLSLGLAEAQQGTLQGTQRGQWARKLQNWQAKQDDFDDQTIEQLDRAAAWLAAFEKEIEEADQDAFEEWALLEEEVEAERTRLTDAPSRVNDLALRYLNEEWKAADERAGTLSGFFTIDDVQLFASYLDGESYIERAEIEAARQEEALEKELDKLEEGEAEPSPGVLSTIWTLVGWESFGDFAADVALTMLTGGVGKVIKTGTRVRRIIKATRTIRRSAKAATKLRKLAKAAQTMVRLIESVAGGAVPEQLSWLRKNWATVQRKIMTDLIANSTTGDGEAAGSVATRRIAKQMIAAAIDDLFPTKEEETVAVRLALFAWLAGKTGTATRELTLFFKMNVRRRFITNIITEASAAGVDLANPFTEEVLKQASIATAGETAQDLVGALPGVEGKNAQTIIEAARKVIQGALT